ncbi:MAG: alpha/beta fold hydrolase [Subtercola sp.]|nr:alpha/beta fold hydrolase [Subtercola sp.]
MGEPRFGWPSRTAPLLNVALDEGQGPIVVLIHGINSSSESWVNVVPLLSPLYRVIAIDLLGFGKSVAPAEATFTLDEHVAALHATIRSLHLKGRFTLVGHSLGALISSRYAAIYRREIAQVVLVAPPIYANEAYITEFGDRTVVKSYLRAYKFLRSNKEQTMRRAEWLHRFIPVKALLIEERYWGAFALSMEHCIEGQTTITDIAQITVPVEVVYGSRDQVLVGDGIERLARLQHVTVHEVPKNDHFVRPALAREVARVIR